MANKNLNQAKNAKKDEFYTQLVDIENELKHYKEHFKDKVVLCNCDDPRVSNFFHYFSYNFEKLGLKKLITTCYKNQERDLFSQNDSERAIWLEYNGDKNNNRVPDPDEIGINYFEGDGDFRSRECIELLKQADIVVTNPPFSLFREYVAQLIEYDKKFIIIGNTNALTYKEIFYLFQHDKIRTGYTNFNVGMFFVVPDSFEQYHHMDNGQKIARVSTSCWYTNLPVLKHKEELVVYKKYSPEEYPKYENYDAINVKTYTDIPIDYYGLMGVPITFLDKFNPDQFEIVLCCEPCIKLDILKKDPTFKEYKSRQLIHSGVLCQKTYHRILIRRRQPATQYAQQEETLPLAAEEQAEYNIKK